MEKTKAQMQRMVDIMSQTMEPILFRELNRCDGFFQTITTLAPPEPSYWRTAGGSVRLEFDRITQVNQAAEMIRCQTKEERRIWRDAMSCLGGGLEYSGLDLREEDRNVEEEFRKQDCYMNQFQDAFHTYTQTIWDLEIRLMEDFKAVEDMGAGCGIRKIGPLLSWDKTFNEDRLIGLMNSSPDRLTETDFTDMIMTLDRVDLVEDMGLLGKILKGMYQVEGTPDGSGAYRLTYRLSKVAFDLSKRYQAHVEETVKKGLVSQEEQGLLGLKACLLSGLTAEYAVLYGGTTAMLSKLTGGRTNTIDVPEFLKSVIDKSLELSEKKYQALELVWDNLQKPLDDHLSGDLGDFLVDLTAFTPGFSVIVGYEILGTFVASRIWGKEAAESYWDVRNRALKGYIKGAIDTELDILKSTLLMGMKTSNQIEFNLALNKTYAEIWEFGVVNYGKAVLKGIGEDLLSLWTKLKDGDAQERGEVVGGLAVQAALAYWSVSEILTSIKAIKAAKAAKGLAAGAGLVDDGLGLLDDAVKAADNIVGMADDAAGAVDDIAGVADDAAKLAEGGSGAAGKSLLDLVDDVRLGKIKLQDLPIDDQIKIANQLKLNSPIGIPENITPIIDYKNGYEQITFKWSDGTNTYTVRWHTKTPNAPAGTPPNWRVDKKIPGFAGGKDPITGEKIPGYPSVNEVLVSPPTGTPYYIDNSVWKAATTAYANGTATQAQKEILEWGHIITD